MAADYAAEHGENLSGVILLAAYPTKKLADSLEELQVIGSEDRVINRRRLEHGRAYASAQCTIHVLEGGNHAQFGSYGTQRGDGTARITMMEQVRETVHVIVERL